VGRSLHFEKSCSAGIERKHLRPSRRHPQSCTFGIHHAADPGKAVRFIETVLERARLISLENLTTRSGKGA
jgi:hypothetical protein